MHNATMMTTNAPIANINGAGVSVRQATLADTAQVAPLFDGYRQFYRQAPDLALAHQFIHDRMALRESVIFLAQNTAGEALGFTQLYPSFSSASAGRLWILNDLYVQPTARGRGVAHALMEASRQHAIATGAKGLELSTAHDNPAQKLYESLGYQRDHVYYYYSLTI
jgi:GNAT superfamily N-acetyltransferase